MLPPRGKLGITPQQRIAKMVFTVLSLDLIGSKISILYGVILYIMGKRRGNKLESFPY